VRHYATLAAPLTDLLHDRKFKWPATTQQAFTELILQLTKLSTLHLPDFSKPFVVETDASQVAIGAMLSQDGHPLSFFNKKMCPCLQASSVFVREMYAITEVVKKWRQYLLGQQFKIYMDQKSLNTLLSQTIQTLEQQKWTTRVNNFCQWILQELHETPIAGRSSLKPTLT